MQKLFFWLKWDQPFKNLATLLFLMLISSIAVSVILLIIGPDGLMGWHTFSQKVAVEVITQTVDIGPFKFPFNEQLFVIKEFVTGGEMPNTVAEKRVILFLMFGLFSLILTLFTYFNRWGFMIFSVFIFLFIIFIHPERLQMAEVEKSWILGGVFLMFVGPAYYFQSFNKNASFGIRLFTLLLISGIFLS